MSRTRLARLSALATAAAFVLAGDLARLACAAIGAPACGGQGNTFAVAVWLRALVVVPIVALWWRRNSVAPPRRAVWLVLPLFLAVWTWAARLAYDWISGSDFVTEMVASGQRGLLLSATLIAAPISEELLFRGLLLDYARRWSLAFAVGASSLAWALLHAQYEIDAIAGLFAMGLVLAGARLFSGSIALAIVLHAWWNAVVLYAAGMRW